MIDEAHRQLGGLHFVISLASDFPYNPLGKLDGAAWDRSMAGAKGSYLLALHASRKMRDNPGPTRGHIILFGDTSARETPYRNSLPYLTSKAAVEYMVRAFAVELARHGVLVNAIAPGPTIRPPEIEPHEWDEIIEQTTPLKRESSPDDMAEIAVALLRSETITGESVRVDGGNHIAGPYELA
jgi:NAD(P)-dependent dehydrogenase (short-subunit alcohol dehydrogenase family)